MRRHALRHGFPELFGGGHAVGRAGNGGIVLPRHADRRGIELMGMDQKIGLGTHTISIRMDPLLAGGLDLAFVAAIRDPALDQILLAQSFVRTSAGRDDKFVFRDPGTDIAPRPGHQGLRKQLPACGDHAFSCFFFRIYHE